MKTYLKAILLNIVLLSFCLSCSKSEKTFANNTSSTESADVISYAASQEIEGKKFIKTAEINLEVNNVFETSIALENKLKTMGGFVTSSNMHSNITSERRTSISTKETELIRTYRIVNDLRVSVPNEKLSEFLQEVHQDKVFIHSRIITAEDVTANSKMAKWEQKRFAENKKDLGKLKNTNKKFDRKNENRKERNQTKLNELKLNDQIKYSSVYIHLEEPSEKTNTIIIENTEYAKNKIHFWHEIKEAFADGYYGILYFFVYLSKAWAFILIGFVIWFGFKKLKKSKKKKIQ